MESCWRWGTDLVLLPETAVSKDYDEQLKEFSLISDFADTHGCTLVTGSFYLETARITTPFSPMIKTALRLRPT